MKLEDLQASAAVRGILSDGLVTVVRAAQGTLLNNENNWLRRFGDASARIDHIPWLADPTTSLLTGLG